MNQLPITSEYSVLLITVCLLLYLKLINFPIFFNFIEKNMSNYK